MAKITLDEAQWREKTSARITRLEILMAIALVGIYGVPYLGHYIGGALGIALP